MWRKESNLKDEILKLTWVDIYAAYYQHIVRAAADLLYPPHRSCRRGKEASDIARAIADHWQCLLGERREDEFTKLTVGDDGRPLWVDDFGIEMVLPNDRTVFALNAFACDSGSHNF